MAVEAEMRRGLLSPTMSEKFPSANLTKSVSLSLVSALTIMDLISISATLNIMLRLEIFPWTSDLMPFLSFLIFTSATSFMIQLLSHPTTPSKTTMFSPGLVGSNQLKLKSQWAPLILVELIVKDLAVKINAQPKNGAERKEDKFMEICVWSAALMKRSKIKDASLTANSMKFLLMGDANALLATWKCLETVSSDVQSTKSGKMKNVSANQEQPKSIASAGTAQQTQSLPSMDLDVSVTKTTSGIPIEKLVTELSVELMPTMNLSTANTSASVTKIRIPTIKESALSSHLAPKTLSLMSFLRNAFAKSKEKTWLMANVRLAENSKSSMEMTANVFKGMCLEPEDVSLNVEQVWNSLKDTASANKITSESLMMSVNNAQWIQSQTTKEPIANALKDIFLILFTKNAFPLNVGNMRPLCKPIKELFANAIREPIWKMDGVNYTLSALLTLNGTKENLLVSAKTEANTWSTMSVRLVLKMKLGMEANALAWLDTSKSTDGAGLVTHTQLIMEKTVSATWDSMETETSVKNVTRLAENVADLLLTNAHYAQMSVILY